MRKMLKEAVIYILIGLAIWGLVAVFSVAKSVQVAKVAWKAFAGAAWIIISVFFFIGLIQAWVTPEQLSRYLGKSAGWKRFAFASTIPILLGGSLFTMLPLTKSLKDKGASDSAILAFLTAWSGKAPLIPLEAQFLGWRFTLIRTALIIPTAIIMGLAGEFILDRWKGAPAVVSLNDMATGELLAGEAVIQELDTEYGLRKSEADKLVSSAAQRVKFELLGDILERDIPRKLAELASKYEYELVEFEATSPSLNFSTDGKRFPSKAQFILASTSTADISEHLDAIRQLLLANGITIVSEKRL
ncbi:MAG: permease [Candidatus Cryosericum sp.]